MSRNISLHRAQRPIFVDASGRRQRGLQVAGAIGILSAVGYIGVLLSTVLRGADDPLGLAAASRGPLARSGCRSASQGGAYELDGERSGSAAVRRGGADSFGAAQLVRHSQPDVHFSADGCRADSCSDEGQGQADRAADTSEPADQDTMMTPGARCNPSL